MNKLTITAIVSIVSVLMLCIGIGIIVIPPIVFEAFYSYSSDNEAIIEEVTNSPLMMSMLPTLASTSYSWFNRTWSIVCGEINCLARLINTNSSSYHISIRCFEIYYLQISRTVCSWHRDQLKEKYEEDM